MALIRCPKCGKSFSEYASKCPQCGITIEDALLLQKKQTEELWLKREKEAAERERIRLEEEAQKAEKERVKAEKRKEWWVKNDTKIIVSIIILMVLLVTGIIIYIYISNEQKERAIAEAQAYIHLGDSCAAIYHFDEADKYYNNALNATTDEDTHQKAYERSVSLGSKKNQANKAYEEALKRLKILLDADDYEFNQYSNDCLNKMIEIYPDRQETIYYRKIRKNPYDVKVLSSRAAEEMRSNDSVMR